HFLLEGSPNANSGECRYSVVPSRTTLAVLWIPAALNARCSIPLWALVSNAPAPCTRTGAPEAVVPALRTSFRLAALRVFWAAAGRACLAEAGVTVVVGDEVFFPPPHAASASGNTSSPRATASRRGISTCAPAAPSESSEPVRSRARRRRHASVRS